MRSKHNSSYWQGKPYFGFGPSAHSFDGKNKRRWNIANNALYIKSILANTIAYEEEVLTDTQQLNEYIMTSIRTIEGIELDKVESRFGVEKKIQLINSCQSEIEAGRMIRNESNVSLSSQGKLFADGIAANLFFE
jgi:oxygen-independent coproporphyrinogen-3 oxidase